MDAGNTLISLLLEVSDEIVDSSLGLAEDDHPCAVVVLLQDGCELSVLIIVLAKLEDLRDP